jgi:hypothetical protein
MWLRPVTVLCLTSLATFARYTPVIFPAIIVFKVYNSLTYDFNIVKSSSESRFTEKLIDLPRGFETSTFLTTCQVIILSSHIHVLIV